MSTLVYSSSEDTPRHSRIGILESSDYDSGSEFGDYEDTESSIDGTEYSFELTLQETTTGNAKCEKCREIQPLESFVGRQTEKTNKRTRDCQRCREKRNSRKRRRRRANRQDHAVVRYVTWPDMISHFERQVKHDPEYCCCFMITDIRDGITSHNTTYFVIEDIVAAFSREQWMALKSNLVKTRKDLCTFLVQCLGTVFGYVFTFQKDREAAGAVHLTYHCSQRTRTAQKSHKVDNVSKQRQRVAEERYPCDGRVILTFNNTGDVFNNTGDDVYLRLGGKGVLLGQNGLVVHFYHASYHPPRQRKPFPPAVRRFIQTNFRHNCSDMIQEIHTAKDRGDIRCNIKELTDDNIRYWWSLVRRERIETDHDPWVSAVNFLIKQQDV